MTEDEKMMINAYEQWKKSVEDKQARDPRRYADAWKSRYGKSSKNDPNYAAFLGFVGAIDAYRAEQQRNNAYVVEYTATPDGMRFISTIKNANAYQMKHDTTGGLMLRHIKFLALKGADGIISAYNIGFRRGEMKARKER